MFLYDMIEAHWASALISGESRVEEEKVCNKWMTRNKLGSEKVTRTHTQDRWSWKIYSYHRKPSALKCHQAQQPCSPGEVNTADIQKITSIVGGLRLRCKITPVWMSPSCHFKRDSQKNCIYIDTALCSPFPKELLKSHTYLCTKAYSTFDQFTQPGNQLTQDRHIQILQALQKGKGQGVLGGEKGKVMVADLSWSTSSWGWPQFCRLVFSWIISLLHGGKKAPQSGFHHIQILLSHFYAELTLLKLSFAGTDVLQVFRKLKVTH